MSVNPWKALFPEPRLRPTSALRPIYWVPHWSLAVGIWDGNRALLIRWNGGTGTRGNPMSRAYPTWFVLPDRTMLTEVAEPNRSSAAAWLDGLDPITWSDPVPTGWGDY